jgi:hypothetical protein
MKQVARNLVDPVDGFLRGATHLIHDRDPLFTEAFLGILGTRGVESVKIPAQSPNCNPHAEALVALAVVFEPVGEDAAYLHEGGHGGGHR